MARHYSTAQKAALAEGHVVHCEMLYVEGPSNNASNPEDEAPQWELRLNTSGWNLEYGGFTWNGVGTMLRIDRPDDDFSLAPNPLNIYLAGVTPAMASLALRQPLNGTRVILYHAIFDAETYQLLEDPVVEYSYRASNLTLINPGQENG